VEPWDGCDLTIMFEENVSFLEACAEILTNLTKLIRLQHKTIALIKLSPTVCSTSE
jgi:hypothetical protein